jgi:glycerol-3-phosphate cytidylyltransferase-like family protein
MRKLVIIPGGYHPYHAGHAALYRQARETFPDADVYVAATDDTSTRPFPFAVKEKLAKLAGVEPGHFVRVKSPFRAEEITQAYDPADTVLIFVRSSKDQDKPPKPSGVKRDGSPAYLQPLTDDPRPMTQHGYMAYLPTVEFAGGLTSATEIRNRWPAMSDRAKQAMVMTMYPRTQNNARLAATVVKLLDSAMSVAAESRIAMLESRIRDLLEVYRNMRSKTTQDYVEEKWSAKYKRSINCDQPRGFSQKAHCASRQKRS